jgi:hypothetical protein
MLPRKNLPAAPEYVNMEAYNTLNTNSFAFKLPFDLTHTEASAYFKRLVFHGRTSWRILAISGNPSAESITAEALGLTEAEQILIITADTANQELYLEYDGAKCGELHEGGGSFSR